MTVQSQRKREKTWLEKLEEFLTDEFHHGLHRIMLQTLGSDVRVGQWSDELEFFRCLNNEYEYLLANQTKPLQVEMHLGHLNFSGQELVNGASETFWASRLPCSRQKTLLLHSLRLMLENKDKDRANLSLIIPILRRELHQGIRSVFFNLKNGKHANGLLDFIEVLDQHESLEMNDVRLYLMDHTVSWLEQEGVERSDIEDPTKLGKFWRTLNRYVHYHPKIDEPVDFKYGHLFSDWQKFCFCGSLIYEIDRLGSLVNLERLSHKSHVGSETGAGQLSQLSEELSIEPKSRNAEFTTARRVLALHYLLDGLEVDLTNKSAETRFIKFLIDRDETDIKRKLTEIRERENPPDKRSKKALPRSAKQRQEDLRFIRPYFEELKLTRITNAIDDEIRSTGEDDSVEVS